MENPEHFALVCEYFWYHIFESSLRPWGLGRGGVRSSVPNCDALLLLWGLFGDRGGFATRNTLCDLCASVHEFAEGSGRERYASSQPPPKTASTHSAEGQSPLPGHGISRTLIPLPPRPGPMQTVQNRLFPHFPQNVCATVGAKSSVQP
eukprot:6183815-Amphidinium_carterae.1